jgi:hypothetical protein
MLPEEEEEEGGAGGNVAEAGVGDEEEFESPMAAQRPGGIEGGKITIDPVFIFMMRYMATMNCSIFKTPAPDVSTRFLK